MLIEIAGKFLTILNFNYSKFYLKTHQKLDYFFNWMNSTILLSEHVLIVLLDIISISAILLVACNYYINSIV